MLTTEETRCGTREYSCTLTTRESRCFTEEETRRGTTENSCTLTMRVDVLQQKRLDVVQQRTVVH